MHMCFENGKTASETPVNSQLSSSVRVGLHNLWLHMSEKEDFSKTLLFNNIQSDKMNWHTLGVSHNNNSVVPPPSTHYQVPFSWLGHL